MLKRIKANITPDYTSQFNNILNSVKLGVLIYVVAWAVVLLLYSETR